jgi:hypothetical protein
MKKMMLTLLFASILPLAACTVAVRPPHPGMVLVEGVWVVPPRANAVWVPGHWQRVGWHQRVWVRGGWRY